MSPSLARLFVAGFVVAMDGIAVAVALPSMSESVGGLANADALISIYLVGQAPAMLLAARIVDRGRLVTMFRTGAAALAVTSLATAATSGALLLSARLAQGAAAGVLAAVGAGAVGRLPDGQRRVRMIGWLSSAFALGTFVGPMIIGAILEVGTWRTVFVVASLPAVWLAGSTRSRAEPGPASQGRSLPWGTATWAVLVAVGLTLRGDRRAAGIVALGVAAVAAIRARRLVPAAAASSLPAVALLSAAMFASMLYLPAMAESRHGLGPLGTGLLTAATFGVGSLATIWSARWAPDLLDERARVVIAGVVAAVGHVTVALSSQLAVLAVGLALVGAGLSIARSNLTSWAQGLAEVGQVATVGTHLALATSLAGIGGLTIAATVLGRLGGDPATTFALLHLIAAAGVLLAVGATALRKRSYSVVAATSR